MTYIVDFFGVISSEVAPFWFAEYLPNYDIAELRKKYVGGADLGRTPLNTFYKKLAKLTNQETHIVAQEWHDLAKIDIEAVSVVEQLGKKSKIALCSNAPANLIRPILQENDLEKLFNVIVISSEVRMVKPNDDIFIQTLELLKTTAAETTFIDDSEANVRVAERLGMNTILYKNVADIAQLLKD